MDFSTLVASPAQAGPQSPVAKTGIGPAARAGAAPGAKTPADTGFATLVAIAVDRNDGASPSTAGAAKDGGTEVPVVDGTGDDESPLEGSADAATLSLLIALTTPVAAAAVTPQPEAAGQCDLDPTAIGGDAAGTVTATASDLVPSQPPPAAATTPFPDAPPAAPASVAPRGDGPVAAAAVSETSTATGTPGAAATPAPAASTPATTPAPADAPAPAPEAATPSPTPTVAAPAAASTRGTQKPAAHPLRQALAEIAATAPAAATTTEASQADSASAASRPAGAAAPAATPMGPAASSASHDGRAVTTPRVDASVAAPAAASGSASDAGATGGEPGAGGSTGFAAASAPASGRGAEVRLDMPSIAPTTASTPEIAAATALPAFAGFGANGDAMLRAIEVPAAARFEQALTAVDPDVQNLQSMVRTVRLFAAGEGAHEARLQLAPDHLGPVALTVRVEQGSVSAHFRAETPAAQRWIETHQQELRAGLREQGLEVKDVVVTTDPDGRRERRQDAQPARPARARRAQVADAPRFEVLV